MTAEKLESSHRPAAVLAKNSRTFWWASRVLPAGHRAEVEQLYAFCRTADDIADLQPDSIVSAARLREMGNAIRELDVGHPVAGAAIDLIRQGRVPATAALHLVDTLAGDIGPRALSTEDELLDFAYGAAGTVGEMLCRLLGAADLRARPFAIDLGVAMQLTNIARDVLADAAMRRIYLPASWLKGGVSCEALLQRDAATLNLAVDATRRLLALADRYYASARLGYRFLPSQPRAAVAIAARSYRAIGTQLLGSDPLRWWLQPEVIASWRRAVAIIGGIADAVAARRQANLKATRDASLLAW